MKVLLLIGLVLSACTQAKTENEVTTDTTAAAITGQEPTPASQVTAAPKNQGTTETTAAATAPAERAAIKPANGMPAARLLADDKKSEPSGCDRLDCPKGTRCELVEVQCIQAPCPPMPECRPEAEPSK